MGRWRSVVVGVALLSVGCGGGLPDAPVPPPAFEAVGDAVPLGDEPERWFDFWPGEWDVANLQLGDDHTWAQTGTARAVIAAVAGGSAVLEDWDGTLGDTRLRGQSLRAWDPATKRWDIRLYWHAGEEGSFYAMEGERDGDALRQFPPDDRTSIRYSFRDLHAGSAVWEEARTRTDGAVWIPTWVMQFTRAAAPAVFDAANAPVVVEMPDVEGRPTDLDRMVGAWRGTARRLRQDGGWEDGTALARVSLAAGGYGVVQYLDTSWGERTLTVVNHDRREDGLVALRASSERPALREYVGRIDPDPGGGSPILTLTSDARRERWQCGENTCTWSRELAGAAAGMWDPVLEISFERLPGTSAWIDVRGARMPLAGVLTGGQPTAEELREVASAGYRTVVNLRAADEDGALADEAALVTGLGLDYVHIPVDGAAGITDENAAALAAVLDDPAALPALVHCAGGNRVGALLALDAHAGGMSAEDALAFGVAGGLTGLTPVVRERLETP